MAFDVPPTYSYNNYSLHMILCYHTTIGQKFSLYALTSEYPF